MPVGHPQANEGNIFFFSPSLPLLDLGAVSAARESWEYDSGARDLQSPDLQTQSALQKLLEYGGSSWHQQAAALHKLLAQSPRFGSSVGGSYLELANTVSTFRFMEHISRMVCIPRQIFKCCAPGDVSDIVFFINLHVVPLPTSPMMLSVPNIYDWQRHCHYSEKSCLLKTVLSLYLIPI